MALGQPDVVEAFEEALLGGGVEREALLDAFSTLDILDNIFKRCSYVIFKKV